MKKISIACMVAVAGTAVFGESARLSPAESIGCGIGRLIEMSNVSLCRIDDLFARRIGEIEKTPNMSIPAGALRRYLSAKGDDAADGLTPQTAWRTIERLNREKLEKGTYVLFERGGFFSRQRKDKPWCHVYGDWRFEPSRFPDPKAMIDELHAMGYKVMLWMCPYVGKANTKSKSVRRPADGGTDIRRFLTFRIRTRMHVLRQDFRRPGDHNGGNAACASAAFYRGKMNVLSTVLTKVQFVPNCNLIFPFAMV